MNNRAIRITDFVTELESMAAMTPAFDRSEFLRDLAVVHQSIPSEEAPLVVTDQVLAELDGVLAGLRSAALARLGGEDWLEKLPRTDPLLSRVGLFGTLDLGLRETAHTRAIGWLLDSNEEHGFGPALLERFLQHVFVLEKRPSVSDVRVHTELFSSDRRDRHDIVMSGDWMLQGLTRESWAVIVEAKAESDEGENQCARYEEQASRVRQQADRHLLVFLTPDGRRPETSSKRVGWQPLSFLTLMAVFRQELPSLANAPGFEFLRLYMVGVLRDICGIECGKIGPRTDLYHIGEYLSLLPAGKE